MHGNNHSQKQHCRFHIDWIFDTAECFAKIRERYILKRGTYLNEYGTMSNGVNLGW